MSLIDSSSSFFAGLWRTPRSKATSPLRRIEPRPLKKTQHPKRTNKLRAFKSCFSLQLAMFEVQRLKEALLPHQKLSLMFF